MQAAETVLMWGGFLALQLVKTRFQRCSGAYLGLFAVQIVLSLAASAFFAWQARNANMVLSPFWVLRAAARRAMAAQEFFGYFSGFSGNRKSGKSDEVLHMWAGKS